MNRTAAGPNRDFAIGYDLMNYVNDTVPAAIENAVPGSVDHELATMIRGESFEKRVQNLIDARLQSLVSKIGIKTSRCRGTNFHAFRTAFRYARWLGGALLRKMRCSMLVPEKTIFPGEHVFGFDVTGKIFAFGVRGRGHNVPTVQDLIKPGCKSAGQGAVIPNEAALQCS